MGVPPLQMSKAGSVFLRSEMSSIQARKASVWQQMFSAGAFTSGEVNLTPPEMTAFTSKSLGQ
jgi:hypothetical protein